MLAVMVLRTAHKTVTCTSLSIMDEPERYAVTRGKLWLEVGNVFLALGNGQELKLVKCLFRQLARDGHEVAHGIVGQPPASAVGASRH